MRSTCLPPNSPEEHRKTKLKISERCAGVAEVDNNGAGRVSQVEGNPKAEAMGVMEVRTASWYRNHSRECRCRGIDPMRPDGGTGAVSQEN